MSAVSGHVAIPKVIVSSYSEFAALDLCRRSIEIDDCATQPSLGLSCG